MGLLVGLFVLRTILGLFFFFGHQVKAVVGVELEQWGDTGQFLSPGYPGRYPSNQNLTYLGHLDTPGPLWLRVTFTVSLEGGGTSCYDYVLVEGKRVCGAGTITMDFRINGSEFVMVFYSDEKIEKNGFNVTYHVLPESGTVTPTVTYEASTIGVTPNQETTAKQSDDINTSSPTQRQTAMHTDETTPNTFSVLLTWAAPPQTTTDAKDGSVTSVSDDSITSDVTNDVVSNDVITPLTVAVSEQETTSASEQQYPVTQSTTSLEKYVTTTGVSAETTSHRTYVTSSDVTPSSLSNVTLPRIHCRCVSVTRNMSTLTARQEEDFDQLVKSLTLKKSNMSSTWRRYVSVPDSRRSAQAIGAVGIVMCALPLILFLVADVTGLCAHFESHDAGHL